ncbi:unnamed protein product, partial [Ixodes persulcatus]
IKSRLTVHKLSHSDEKPFKCPSCANWYPFAKKQHLTNHELIHAGPKPFTCSTSSEEFCFRSKMNVHEPIHVPVAYKCPTCPKLF